MKDCIKSTGEISEEIRQTEEFNNIEVSGKINVIISQDSIQKVTIEAGKNLIDLIETNIIDNTLFIKNRNTCNWVRSYEPEINIYIQVPEIINITHKGSGNVIVNNFDQKLLKISNFNVGDFKLNNINIGHLFLYAHSFGDIYANGTAVVSEVYCIGNSYFHLGDLKTAYTYLYNNSTGDVTVNAWKELGIRIDGIGNVYYTGGAEIVNSSVKGEGKMIKAD